MNSKLLNILKKYTAVSDEDITLESSLYDDLAISSIKFYLMVLDIESCFNIKFENVSMSSPEFNTVESIFKYIKKKRDDVNEL